LQRTGDGKQINAKKLFKSKTVHKSRWFCSIGEYKSSWIFKQLEIIGENSVSKLLMLSKNSENAMEMILNGGKKNSRLTLKI
jgi:excinuclease ABC subunit A